MTKDTKPASPKLDLKALQQLADWLDASTMEEAEIETGGVRLRLKKPGSGMVMAQAPSPKAPVITVADNGPPANAFTSPMVGTFYRSSGPDAAPFVNEGDAVKVGQTLCIIEAMKTMNQIAADKAGVVKKIIATNAQPVEFGQPLFVIE
ncbi:MAG: acetyl-CoA carboxylase biotin carboxyl carrier protein [Alphaproteobacteria bacterium]